MAASSSNPAADPAGLKRESRRTTRQRRAAKEDVAEAERAQSPITIVVNGCGGPRCTLEASTKWTIRKVHQAIFNKTSIPVDWQTLIKGTEILALEVTVGSLIGDGFQKLELTLVVVEVPEPKLIKAIQRGDGATALELLEIYEVPDLNDNVFYKTGQRVTVLHFAIDERLPEVATAIVKTLGFLRINVSSFPHGKTALHLAVLLGNLRLCQAILEHPSFTELMAVDSSGRTALAAARRLPHGEIVQCLQEAERRFREAQRLRGTRRGNKVPMAL